MTAPPCPMCLGTKRHLMIGSAGLVCCLTCPDTGGLMRGTTDDTEDERRIAELEREVERLRDALEHVEEIGESRVGEVARAALRGGR
jgi:tRNA(Arg) A34 adenosine deaminase TadA